ncbi:MAG: TetR/AcrR family transcriptional regulator [Oscillibacter sp.]
MPSSTFLKLPPGKQEKLLEAATREFSRRPFSEASINQIIKDAGIPRGSFYMYFQDKEDLFRYLMKGYVDQLLLVLEELLIREQGDIFEALLALYDYVQRKQDARQLGEIGAMAAIVGCNSGLQKTTILDMVEPGVVLERLKKLINPELLDLRQEGDLNDILALLLLVAGPLIYNGVQCRRDEAAQAHLRSVMEILKHGMARKSCPAAT